MDFIDQHILDEVQRIKYLYKMKGVIRYNRERDKNNRAESVAEHIYGMMVLIHYFLPLEDPEQKWDRQKIMDMAVYHDIDEIEHGDVISYQKTDADRAREKEDGETALRSSPQNMVVDVRDLLEEYESQETVESRFVKAIDKIEPAFEVFDEYGKKILQTNKTTYDQGMDIKIPHLREFPTMLRFSYVIGDEMRRQGYFYEGE